ncbi:hypothetical protein J120_02995 [candidate division TM6 bacterium JCVI TM6SC1]|uniref:AAA family ATPase n=1 Tax=candidate division TM6 bacterium JCVI TM6SC1 TaxID=1306947 RepID=A0A0D2K4X6_9BACT|nr:hypothetical protein J120_02995 [candidate division TM6 bacterium JCVI TM6SC1]
MISRHITPYILKSATKLPVIALLGPRQSGKTTLARFAFANHAYVSMENYEEREFAQNDPKRFLRNNINEHGIILDEIQHVPQLLSYIQTYVDEYNYPGRVIITGSQNLLVNQAISQTLAGRIALFTLLPLSINELKSSSLLPYTADQVMLKGGYPRIYASEIEPQEWYPDYIETYVERDVRQIINVVNLATFKRFIRLCAGRIGQLINFTSLANDCGIDVRTAQHWLSILQASYIVFLLQPHFQNFNKRMIKTPKLYFYDTGLACSLLGITTLEQLDTYYMRGNIFESLMISEICKHYYNIKQRPDHVYFWRDKTGNEIDCLIEQPNTLIPVEIKSGTTVSKSFFDPLIKWSDISNNQYPQGYVLYAGDKNHEYKEGTLVSWNNIEVLWQKTIA